MRRRVVPKLSPKGVLLGLAALLVLGWRALAVCPPACSCSRSHREVDCSRRGLRQLPDGLQHNVHSLNLSHNRLHDLDRQLTAYTHLRVLDLSHNRLSRLPAALPRSLWRLRAAHNCLRLLDKNDTVHQWNLRTLDLSHNQLERATFINNTLIGLRVLNLSRNHFWTLPTNMPVRLEVVDLSHNLLVRVLPGSLDRLPALTHFYLHANRLPTLPVGALDEMRSLRVITLGNNPWACHLYADVRYLLSWTQQTPTHVLGCPCHTQPVCGGARTGRGGGWHYASYNLPPLAASAQELSSAVPPGSGVTGWGHSSVSAPNSPATSLSISAVPPRDTGTHLTINHLSSTANPAVADHMLPPADIPGTDSLQHADTSSFSDATGRFLTTVSPHGRTKKTTTLRTRSVRRQNHSHSRGVGNNSPTLTTTCSSPILPLLHILGLWLLPLHHAL